MHIATRQLTCNKYVSISKEIDAFKMLDVALA